MFHKWHISEGIFHVRIIHATKARHTTKARHRGFQSQTYAVVPVAQVCVRSAVQLKVD